MNALSSTSCSASFAPIAWQSPGDSRFFSGVSAAGGLIPVFGTKGLLAASAWRECDAEALMALSPTQPEVVARDIRLRLEHDEPFTSGAAGILRARLLIDNHGSGEVSLVAGFETGLRPSRSTCLEKVYLPLTAQGVCAHAALSQLGKNQQIESMRSCPGAGERIAAHYLEPLGSELGEITTKIPLLIPMVTQLNPQAPVAVSLFATPELPWAAIREGSEQGEHFWRLQTRVHLMPGASCALEVFLTVHEPAPAAAWPLFHRHAAPLEPVPVEWLQKTRMHYFDFLSPDHPDSPRGRGFQADAGHFAAFGVGLATQHGYYPHWGDYIHPDRPRWRAMAADVHGGMEMSFEEMRARIALARHNEGRAGVYIHLVGFDDASPHWPRLREGCRIEICGSRTPFPWKGPDVLGTSRYMSISNPVWSGHLLEQARWIFELLNPDAIVVDETFGGIGYDYVNGSAQVASSSTIRFFKDLRALARSFGPDKAILTSDCGLSSFVLWADAEAGDHAYASLLGHPEYRREPVRYLAALGNKRWIPCAWLWQEFWEAQLDLAHKTGAGIGVANGWLDYAGLAGLAPAAKDSYLRDLANLPHRQRGAIEIELG